MRRFYSIIIGVFLIFTFIGINSAFCQPKETREEKIGVADRLKKDPLAYRLYSQIGIFTGYDSNANLDSERKGDVFQEFMFSLDFIKPLADDLDFGFTYDLDYLNYSEFTDVSSLLNHLAFSLHKDFSVCTIGGGYDLGVLYYPKDDEGNFLLHQGFIYARKDTSRKASHMLRFKGGLKDYMDQRALANTIFTYKDNKRQDQRMAGEYSFRYRFNPRLRFKFKFDFVDNDSNARFQNYYDYQTFRESAYLEYKLLKKLDVGLGFSYRLKEYDTRTTVLGTSRQDEELYTGRFSLMYELDKKNVLSLMYTYRDNNSNESMDEYVENLISCGWQHYF